MAKNRMYLRCKACGDILFLGRTMGYGYHLFDKEIYYNLNDFYEEHNFCDKEKNKDDIEYCDTPLGEYKYNDNVFEIAYEIDENVTGCI